MLKGQHNDTDSNVAERSLGDEEEEDQEPVDDVRCVILCQDHFLILNRESLIMGHSSGIVITIIIIIITITLHLTSG